MRSKPERDGAGLMKNRRLERDGGGLERWTEEA